MTKRTLSSLDSLSTDGVQEWAPVGARTEVTRLLKRHGAFFVSGWNDPLLYLVKDLDLALSQPE